MALKEAVPAVDQEAQEDAIIAELIAEAPPSPSISTD